MNQLYPLLFPGSYLLCLAIERIAPNRSQPRLGGRWVATGIVFFIAAGIVNFSVPNIIGPHLPRMFDLSALGTLGGAAVAFIATSFGTYWLHRLFHRSTWLWRHAHQLHHSAERVDIAGFSFTHPIEIASAAAVGVALATALGVTPAAALIVGYLTFALGLFEHLDVRTPRWVGRIIQRPDMHAIHHQRGVHHYNYGLPLWDMLFGTYRNPEIAAEPTGFWDGASRHVGALLIGKDVTSAPM